MDNKLLSIVVPVYNVFGYIAQCIDSILASANNNQLDQIEILLIDDGSTDGSSSICDLYSKKYKFIRTYHIKNGGLSNARNYGISKSMGEWIVLVDSDDLVPSNYLKRILGLIYSYGYLDIIIFSYQTFINRVPEINNEENEIKEISRNQAFGSLFKEEFLSFAWNKLYKRELFTDIQYPNGRLYEDLATTYRIYDKANKIGMISDVLYFYRTREQSIVHNIDEKSLHDIVLSLIEMEMMVKKKYPMFVDRIHNDILNRAIWYVHYIDNHHMIKDEFYVQMGNIITQSSPFDYRIKTRIEIFAYKYIRPLFKLIGKQYKSLK